MVVASFEKLELFVQGTVGSSGMLSLARITDTLAEANVTMLEAMLKAGVEIWHGVVSAGNALVIPWGHIVCEKALNAADVVGFRYTCIGDNASPSFMKLAAYMAPEGPSAASNTTSALLVKVLKAIESKDKPLQIEPASSKQPKGKGKNKGDQVKQELAKAAVDAMAVKHEAPTKDAKPVVKPVGKPVIEPPAKKQRAE